MLSLIACLLFTSLIVRGQYHAEPSILRYSLASFISLVTLSTDGPIKKFVRPIFNMNQSCFFAIDNLRFEAVLHQANDVVLPSM